MKRRDFLAATTGLHPLADMGIQSKRPNIVFILADDLGWRDTGLYGSQFYETPHIDALGRAGMHFTSAYAASPLCSPTRASILTGLHPARVGITLPECHVAAEVLNASIQSHGPTNQAALEVDSATRLKLEYRSIAETLKQSGYRTGHFGKWHLGREPYDALHQGFDVDVPHTSAPGPTGGYLGPWGVWRGQGEKGEHIEERMAKEAVIFLEENRDHPFFLNYWCFSVHGPIQGKPDLVAKYRRKADPMRAQRNAVNGAMVQSLDEAVGTLTGALKRLGIEDRTIIVFFSDNGGMVHLVSDDAVITSNAPLRSGKSSVYEGGVRVPLIVKWPGVTKPGSKCDQAVQSIDLYPTLLEMARIRNPQGQPLDGSSFAGALRGKRQRSRPIFCHFPHYIEATAQKPATSVCDGGWKLIRFYHDGPDFQHRFELYNLSEDISETRDLAQRMPTRVAKMDRQIEAFLVRTGAVRPKPNPSFKPGSQAFPNGPVTTVAATH